MMMRLPPPMLTMDHRQLAFLCALSRERHFGRAAASCHVTQPTLSARLRQLEEELGTQLIRRGRRFEGFTPEGEKVLAHARCILGEFDALRSELAMDAPLTGRVTIGVIPSALNELGDFLPQLRQAHPELAVRLRELATPALAQGLEEGSLDLVLGYVDAPAMAGFAHRVLHEEIPALVASPVHYRLPDTPDWTALDTFPLCLLTPEMQNRQLLEQRLAARGQTAVPIIEANSIAALSGLLMRGLGVSVLPERFVRMLHIPERDSRPSAELLARRLPGPGDRVGLLWRASGPRGRRLEALLSLWAAHSHSMTV